eukprot:TRINITY_DN27_c0_g1_i1.p1 TRINITY_DN27_c0_g1~~TRINITY_DN27_c0_g1_i1.p1  ORF type:complete len:421 (-),score=148.91 TRINITY_DN27_c0_g1_i1:54-1316(-)
MRCQMGMFFFFQAEDGIRDRSPSRGLGDVYKRQGINAEYMGISQHKQNKHRKYNIMAKTAVLALLVVVGALVALQNHSNTNTKLNTATPSVEVESWVYDLFTHWTQKNGRLYGSVEEKNYRLLVFRQNVLKIKEHNKQGKSYSLAVNQFADLTAEEFKAKYLTLKAPSQRTLNVTYLDTTNAPDSVDWREQGIVGKVKDQGQCGSCWAFSAIASIEGLYAQKNGHIQTFSEQQLVDCSRPQGNLGCNGGLMDSAFKYVKQHGLQTEDQYPYTARDGKCHDSSATSTFTINGFRDVPTNDNDQLAAAVAQGVVSVAIEADTQEFQFYSSGVLDSAQCGTQLDHGVVVVGFGTTDNGIDYWVVRNSWGANWGDNGYVKILRQKGKGAGICGIAKMASYPTAQILGSYSQYSQLRLQLTTQSS